MMTKQILASLLLASLTLTACSSLPSRKENSVVRFALRDDNIASWKEKGDGIAVQLNEEGQRKIASLTRQNPGSELEVYVARTLVAVSTVNRPIRGLNVYLPVDDDKIEAVEALLPASKRA